MVVDLSPHPKSCFYLAPFVSKFRGALQILPPPDVRDNLNEVKRLSIDGLLVKTIAARLSISESTVKRYRKALGIKRGKG
jgi:DNA-binding NarL/FixJ family response regulator